MKKQDERWPYDYLDNFVLLDILQMVNGMALYKGATKTLDHLLQKSLRYKHHKQNYNRIILKQRSIRSIVNW